MADQQQAPGAPIRRPELSEYGITTEQYDRYMGQSHDEPPGLVFGLAFLVLVLVVAVVTYVRTGAVGSAALAGLMVIILFPVTGIAAMLLAAMIMHPISEFRGNRERTGVIGLRIQQYEEARQAYMQVERERAALAQTREKEERERRRLAAAREREQREIAEMQRLAEREAWTSLGGIAFENALARLLEGLGYTVSTTPKSGDEGIDLIVKRRGKTTVVQCKQHKSPAGPAVARELYGAMIAHRAHQALLACTSGFTRGTIEFAKGKPILLWSVDDLVRWARELNERRNQ